MSDQELPSTPIVEMVARVAGAAIGYRNTASRQEELGSYFQEVQTWLWALLLGTLDELERDYPAVHASFSNQIDEITNQYLAALKKRDESPPNG